MLQRKNVVLGVSGSIAAYKAVYLMRLCMEEGARVSAVLTRSAARFIGPLTFSSISGRPAITDMWSAAGHGQIAHVQAAHEADVLVIAPATADLIARLAVGRADDPLSAIALATAAPWVVAPAMETGMWNNPATRANVATLRQRGVSVVAPGEGYLASGSRGAGRMAEPERILEAAIAALTPQDLAGEQILITAGPTREALDPVRFLSNPSTGKMGFALAREARRRGAEVRLVAGPTALVPPPDVEVRHVTTTRQMLAACEEAIDAATVLIMAAAPGDFEPAFHSPRKLKKSETADGMTLQLGATPDILTALRPRIAETRKLVIGFAAESDDLLRHGREKLERKHLDMIVANDITHPKAGFAVDTNAVVLICRDGSEVQLPVMDKRAVATAILDRVAQLRDTNVQNGQRANA